MRIVAWLLFIVCAASGVARAQAPVAKQAAPFQWVNKFARTDLAGVTHSAFRSPSMNCDVGYCIYLPPGYGETMNSEKRYPVVYYLHGGRPGSEVKGVSIAKYVHEAIVAGTYPPVIYVFVNGGPVSHYNMPDQPQAQGETVFIEELIPHIDGAYRTIADRRGRGIEGFSQGGRGTARIAFRHPKLFCSAAAGGGGHATEKRISENNGEESPGLKFSPGDNTWDLAHAFAKQPDANLKFLLYVGDKDFNYEANLDYARHLQQLKIEHELIVVPDTPHSATGVYDLRAKEILAFHARNFGLP